MNLDQLLGMFRTTLPIIIPALVSQGIIPQGTPSDIGSIAVLLISAGWSFIAHTTSAKIAAVTALSDVKTVVTVAAPTSTAVIAAAADAAQPKVVSALVAKIGG